MIEEDPAFWARVDRSGPTISEALGPCWVWLGSHHPRMGYGQVSRRRIRHTKIYVHRYSWMLTFGPIPDGLLVLHRCDNGPCVRPSHLWLGTVGDNNRDAYAKGRKKGTTRPLYGEAGPNARLTEDQVRAIRALRETGLTFREIGGRFGINGDYAGEICRREKWGHLA